MLAVEEKIPKTLKLDEKQLKKLKPKDIIILKEAQDIIEYQANGDKIIRKSYKKVNLTKLVNETKKLIKRDLASQKVEELKKAMEELIKK